MSANNMKSMFDRITNNKIRMGNFETKDQDMECIRSLFHFPDQPFSIADFCAGSGRALEILAQGTTAVTFGIEHIPRRRMTKDIVNLLVANLDEIQVYQSHDNTYHQVYTIGRKRAEKFINRNEVQRVVALTEEGSDLQRLR